MSIPIAVLASGRGSNFDAIHAAIAAGRLDAEIRVVISDQPGAPVLEKARRAGIPALHIAAKLEAKGALSVEERRREHEERIVAEIERVGARFVVMAGYMRVVSSYLIEKFRSDRGYARVVNIHPSLLPAFSGLNAYAQAYEFGAKLTGVTVHLVELNVDSGPVCAQASFAIEDCKSSVEVEQRGLAIEHQLYPETLAWVLPEKFSVEKTSQGRLRVSPY